MPGIFASPFFGVLSDKIRSVKLCFILCLSLSAMLVFSALFTGPAMDMMENWLVQIDLRYREVSYGSMRIWASLAFAVMSLVYVPVLKRMATSYVYVLYFLFALPAIFIALYAGAHSLAPILIAQLFKGASGGMLYACRIRCIYRVSPEGLHTTSMTLVSSVNSIVSIAASAVGGYLLAAMGTRPFFVVIAVLEAAALIYFALSQMRNRAALND